MSSAAEETKATAMPVGRGLPIVRWIALAALPIAEAVIIGVRYEGVDEKFGQGRWWAFLLSQAHVPFNIFLLTAGAFMLLGGKAFFDEYRKLTRSGLRPTPGWPFLLAHFVAFAAFYSVTATLLEGGVEKTLDADRWFLAWAGTALVTLALWLAATFPLNYWGPLLRRCRLPLVGALAVGLLAWGVGQSTLALWQPLHNWTFRVVLAMLRLVYADTVAEPKTLLLGTPKFSVTIHPTCSGFEGIGLIWIFLCAYLWLYRRDFRFPQALVLLPIATVLIWLLNALRIAVLVVIGNEYSKEVALGGFHSQGGWIAFLSVSLGMFVTAHRIRYLLVSEPATQVVEGPNPAAPYLAPLFAILATAMATAAVSSGFDQFYPFRVLVAGAVFWVFRASYMAMGWSWNWPAVGIGVAVFALWMALEPAPETSAVDDPLATGVMSLPPVWATIWLVCRVLGSVLAVPLAEELAFRGFLMRRLIAADFERVPMGQFTWFSFIVSSALFGALHGRWFAAMLAGFAYAGAVYRRRELSDAILAHAVTNAMIAGWVLASGQWSLWE